MGKQSIINKISGVDRVAADTEAALSIVAMEKQAEDLSHQEQEKKQHLITRTHEMVGQIRAAGMFAKFANVSSLVWLRQVKETKIYKDLPLVGTWDKFCDYIGLSRQKADLDLQNLATFGEEFLLTVSSLNVGYRELRKLRQLANNGVVSVEAEYVVIGEEKIPLTQEHTEDLQEAIENLIESKDRAIEENKATLKAKDRVLAEKEKVIQKQEKELAKLVKTQEERGFAPGEEAFLQEIENFKITVNGLALKLDPAQIPENPTPLMTAAYIEAIGYARRIFHGYEDSAKELFGDDTDDDWQPPNLREEDTDAQPVNPCAACGFRRAVGNSKKGVKIPDYHGKCTREGGLCQEKSIDN